MFMVKYTFVLFSVHVDVLLPWCPKRHKRSQIVFRPHQTKLSDKHNFFYPCCNSPACLKDGFHIVSTLICRTSEGEFLVLGVSLRKQLHIFFLRRARRGEERSRIKYYYTHCFSSLESRNLLDQISILRLWNQSGRIGTEFLVTNATKESSVGINSCGSIANRLTSYSAIKTQDTLISDIFLKNILKGRLFERMWFSSEIFISSCHAIGYG